ncbi:MAG TPA: hypothetical protein VIG89_02035, partial [Candidatus Acidoferrales bacterium]
AQWYHKAGYAYTARSLSLVLQRDALAELAERVQRAQADDLLVFNPLPWPRMVAGEVPGGTASPRGARADVTSGRHFQDRAAQEDVVVQAAEIPNGAIGEKRFWLKPVEVPGFGYVVLSRADLTEWGPTSQFSEEAVVENERYRLAFDRQQGGILSWYDKRLGREWVDQLAGYPFNGFVHEKVADTAHPWPRDLLFKMEWLSDQVERSRGWKPGWRVQRTQPSRVLVHRVYRTPLGYRVLQLLEAPGCGGPLKQSVFLPDFADYVECESWWDMGLDAHPEATYILYPFDIPGAAARFDLGGQAMVAGSDQLPGVCRDYFTAQQWLDFSNDEFGVTVALPGNPMIQLGDFHFAHNQTQFALERAMFLGWVTNNYWETNFRAHQPGRVHARYRILPHQGAFNEAQAHRFGLEAAHAQPLMQHLGELQGSPPFLPSLGALLHLPESFSPDSPILTLHIKPAQRQPGMMVRLLNASDKDQPAKIASGLLRILTAQVCDLLEKPVQAVGVEDGAVSLNLPPRRVTTLHLTLLFEFGR